MANNAEVDVWVEEPGKRLKVECVNDNARLTIYDIDGSSEVVVTIAYWRWQNVLRKFWPPPSTSKGQDHD
jgi:hypothetical protein